MRMTGLMIAYLHYMKAYQHWLLIICCVGLAACGGSDVKFKPLDGDATVLAFGASLTAGYGVAEKDSYPSVLSKLIGRTVINAGVNGELSADGLSRLPKLLKKYSPALVIISHGGNDILKKKDLAITKKNLIRMIELCRENNAQVLLLGIPTLSMLPKTADFYYEVADEIQVPLDDTTITELETNREYKSDSIHFNVAGYRRMAELIRDFLREHDAIQ